MFGPPLTQPIDREIQRNLEQIKPVRTTLETGAQRVYPSSTLEIRQCGSGATVSEEMGQVESGLWVRVSCAV